MPDPYLVNPSVLEPLFETWQEPNAHRVRAQRPGDPAIRVQGRRPSPISIVQNLRAAVREWREAFYAGASDTSIQLLNHWFNRSHRKTTPAGEPFEFKYYFCQREAIETAIYLKADKKLAEQPAENAAYRYEMHLRLGFEHTNLKGKLKKVGKGAEARMEFVEDEKEISDEDLKALRKLSRELDANTSPYNCIVQELSQEGLPLEIVEIEHVPATTI
jgi:hypothetical protein